MNISLMNSFLLITVLINMYVMGSNRIISAIRAIAFQGVLLVLLAFLSKETNNTEALLFSIIIVIKGFVMPYLLIRVVRKVSIDQEMRPLIGYTPTLLIYGLCVIFSFYIATTLPLLSEHKESIIVPIFFATLLGGMLLVIARQKAVTHVIGYLIMENAVFILSSMLTDSMTFLTEIGVLLDALAGVFIMGVVLNHIASIFDDEDSGKLLTMLKE
ncbi:MAG: hydrogenase [Sulfurospirillum sp.]|nr:hydrogenase [Sulfurospirillum sp.]